MSANTVRVTLDLPANRALARGVLPVIEDARLDEEGTVSVPGGESYGGRRWTPIGTWELIEVDV